MTVRYLTLEEMLSIHHELIKQFGGTNGLRDNALLEAATMRPQNGYYETLNQQAAAIMESLANNHPFLDGNKRMAFFATDVFLRANGYWIDCDNEAAYQFFMQLFDTKQFRYDHLLQWLNLNIKKMEDDGV